MPHGFPLSPTQLSEVRSAMLDTFFRGWDAAHMASPDGQSDIDAIVFRRYDECLNVFIPWIERHMSLNGRRMVELGCGAGSGTSAFARYVNVIDGYDIDGVAIEAGRRRAAILGQQNIRFHLHRPQDVIAAVKANHADGVDAVLLYAVLEHQTVPERLETIRACWDLLVPGGLMAVLETPNRLSLFDPHTALLPFFSMLPAELAVRYASRSPRETFVQTIAAELSASEARAIESLARWGRGVSYHEFEVALGDLSGLVVADGFDPEILSIRPVVLPERCMFTYWRHAKITAPIGFVRQDLDLILKKPGGTPAPTTQPRELPISVLCDPPMPEPKPNWWARLAGRS